MEGYGRREGVVMGRKGVGMGMDGAYLGGRRFSRGLGWR